MHVSSRDGHWAPVLLRGLAVWLLIAVAEILHGAARTVLLEPQVGDFRARQIAVFTGSAIVFALALAFIRWMRADTVMRCLAVGLLWLVGMLGFELAAGRWLMGYSWQRILSDYDPSQGGLLSFGMLVLLAAPLLAARVRHVL